MDFRRVKAILLAVFLALNLFLGYQWWTLRSAVSVYAQPLSDQMASAQSALAKHNVAVAAPIPTLQPVMSLLKVAPDRAAPGSVAALALPGRIAALGAGRPNVWGGAAGRVAETGPGRFTVAYNARLPAGTVPVRPGHVASDVRRWLERHAYAFNAYAPLLSRHTRATYTLVYTQSENGYPLWNARLEATVRGGRLTGYTQTALRVLGTGESRQVINAASALLSIATFMDKGHINADNTVVGIRLGYFSQVQSDRLWYLAPVWRVDSRLGVFYVNAFTGEVGVEHG